MRLRMWILVAITVTLGGCTKFCSRKQAGQEPPDMERGRPGEEQADQAPVKTPNYNGITVTQVVKRDGAPGKGAAVKDGSTVMARYTEWVYDPAALGNQGPKIFETSKDPIQIKVGAGKVIKGFEEGMKGMAKGAKRNLIIPASEAYGSEGKPPKIPPNAMVMIEVEVLSVD